MRALVTDIVAVFELTETVATSTEGFRPGDNVELQVLDVCVRINPSIAAVSDEHGGVSEPFSEPFFRLVGHHQPGVVEGKVRDLPQQISALSETRESKRIAWFALPSDLDANEHFASVPVGEDYGFRMYDDLQSFPRPAGQVPLFIIFDDDPIDSS